MKKSRNINAQILMVLGVIVLINILSEKFFVRFDFTADKRYTLSDATENILDNLDETVTVTAYFTKDLPPDIARTKEDFKDLLIEYNNESHGNVVYEFVNPNEDPQIEQQAMQAGIQPVIVSSREKDEAVQKKVFLGAKVQLGEETDIIPFMQPGAAMEYALSSSIKKLSVKNKPTIGFITGHGEAGMGSLFQASESLRILYNLEEVNLGTAEDLSKYKTLAIVAPEDTIPEEHLDKLDSYLAGGGNLFVAFNSVEGNLTTIQGSNIETGLESWLMEKGLTVEDDFVIDANSGSIGVRQQQGMFNFTTNVKFPYLPIITNFNEHPITQGLEQVILRFASSIEFTGDTAIQYQPIALTSQKSGTASAPVYFDIQKRWTENDFPLSNITVGAVLKGNIVGNTPSGMVVISDGDFAVNGEGRQAQQVQPDNVNLMVNSIDWLSDDTGLIDLRTKGVTSRPLDQVEEGAKALLKWLNFLLPVILILIYGIIRMQQRKNLRVKRMEEGYV